MRRTGVAALLLLASGCASLPPGGGALVTGRVVMAEEPLAGVRVGAWATPVVAATSPAVETRTDGEGYYRLRVPAGSWNVAVFDASRGIYAWSGLNPVHLLGGQEASVGLKAAPIEPPSWVPIGDGTTRISARLLDEGGAAVAEARLSLYIDAEEDLRGPGFTYSAPSDEEGRTSVEEIPPGTYWLLVRKRAPDRMIGPLEEGDLVGFHPLNPLEVKSGHELAVQIVLTEKRMGFFPVAGTTRVAGTVRDAAGAPASGVYVFAYPEEVVGHEKPSAVSPVTGSDGRYTLTLPGGGTWYLGARERYGVNPQPGERYGLYPGTADHSLEVGAGENREGVDIVVEEILGWEQ